MSQNPLNLTSWERRKEYYNNIQLGKDVVTQTKILQRQTSTFINAQLSSSNDIVISQDRIKESIDNVAYSIKDVEDGIFGLQAAFEFGISEVVWQIEQNRSYLLKILDELRSPLTTRANEYRDRGKQAYADALYDDALSDFLESEKLNRYDFTVYISIGIIYLFHLNNLRKAEEYFDKAIKYAKPKSNYFTSFALLYKGLIKRANGLIDDAEKCTADAIQFTNKLAEAKYQNAQYNALLNNPKKSIPLLKEIILCDINYCEKINNENDFNNIREDIKKLFIELREEEKEKVLVEFGKYSELFYKISKTSEEIYPLLNKNENNNLISEIKKIIDRIQILIKRKSYRDYREAIMLIIDLKIPTEELLNKNKSSLIQKIQLLKNEIISDESKITKIENDITKIESNIKSSNVHFISMDDYQEGCGVTFGLSVIVIIFLSLRSCYNNLRRSSHVFTALEDFSEILLYGIIISIGISIIVGLIFSISETKKDINSSKKKKIEFEKEKEELQKKIVNKGYSLQKLENIKKNFDEFTLLL